MTEHLIKTRIRSDTVTIATTATKIPTDPLPTRKTILIQNIGAAAVFLGHDGVTTSNGYQLDAGAETAWDVGEGVDIYGIVAASTEEVRIIEGT